jgi:hypothetical protein
MYSVTIWVVFYFFPLKYGLLAKSSSKYVDVENNRSFHIKRGNDASMVEDFIRVSNIAEATNLSPVSPKRKLSQTSDDDGNKSFQ